MKISAVSVLACLMIIPSIPSSACGCIETSPSANEWRKCSRSVAKVNGESQFYENYIDARLNEKKLLPTTPARFAKLNAKFVKSCGKYEKARQRDLKAGYDEVQVPANSIELMWH